jgi:hypothetical protein
MGFSSDFTRWIGSHVNQNFDCILKSKEVKGKIFHFMQNAYVEMKLLA